MLTRCPWVWTSGAKHPNKGDLWQLHCEAGIKAGGGGSLALSDPEPGLDVMMTHPGAVGQISTPTTSPGISSPQASLSDQLH